MNSAGAAEKREEEGTPGGRDGSLAADRRRLESKRAWEAKSPR